MRAREIGAAHGGLRGRKRGEKRAEATVYSTMYIRWTVSTAFLFGSSSACLRFACFTGARRVDALDGT